MNIINRNKLLPYIRSMRHRIFNITWIKQDGSIRNANVRRHVKSMQSGPASPAHKLSSSHLLVYLMPRMTGDTFVHETGWRKINLETVQSISSRGKTYTVNPEPITEVIDLTTTNQQQPNNLIALSA